MVDFGGLINKAKDLASKNPDKVRAGLDKVEGMVNERTGGKYAGQVSMGAGAIENALGVPGEAKQAFLEEMRSGPESTGATPDPAAPVTADPIDSPEPADRPDPI